MKKDIRFIILIVVQLLIGGILALVIVSGRQNQKNYAMSEVLRGAAEKMHAAGVLSEAITLYEEYLKQQDIDNSIRAKIAFSLGQLQQEEGQYAAALKWFYQVALFDPSSKYINEAKKEQVTLLERLGKVSAAKMALKSNTSLNQSSVKGAQVVAIIGAEKIYDYQINEARDSLPAEYKKNFEKKEGKMLFLQKYVAEELLFKKAQRLQYHQSPEIVKKMKKVEKQLVVEKILNEEIKSKINFDKNDLKNYFIANEDKFVSKERAKVMRVVVKGKKKRDQVIAKLKAGANIKDVCHKFSTQPCVEEYIVKGGKAVNVSAEALNPILKLKQGMWSDAYLSQGQYTVFYSLAKEAESKPNFDQIKERVEMSYRIEKSRGLYQKLIESLLKNGDVQLFADKLK